MQATFDIKTKKMFDLIAGDEDRGAGSETYDDGMRNKINQCSELDRKSVV